MRRSVAWMGLLLVLAVLFVAACGKPTVPEGRFNCDPTDTRPGNCPDGWFCRSNGLCYSTQGDTDADADADGDDAAGDGDADGDDDGDGEVEGGCDPATCNDGLLCNGEEVCTTDGRCVRTLPPDEGTPCRRRLAPGEPEVDGACFVELCRPLTCGDGVVQPGEECDDRGFIDGDGCDSDCTFSCKDHPECDDGILCDGVEQCLDHHCTEVTPLPDGTLCGESMICIAGMCEAPRCGDGVVYNDPEHLEECDDENDIDGDGCDGDCTWSCAADVACNNLALCNGAETCNLTTHVCQPGVPAVDLTPCLDDAGLEGVCRSGTCAGIACGNHTTDPGEQCDDGNTTDGDGCETDCTWSCEADPDCADTRRCNGAETCNMSTHVCQAGIPLADGSECDRDGDPATREICLTGLCGLSICSDGFADTAWGEFCDDGNTVNGDGCESSCVWTCTATPDCDDHDPCSGAETCNTTTHVCRSGTRLPNGTDCTSADVTAGRCRDGTCAPITCGNARPDPGEECDDGNTTDGDGCNTSCVYSCHAAADCPETPTDNPCTTDTCVTGGTGQICRHTPNTGSCNDGDACTSPDACSAGSCAGPAIDADGDTYGPGVACGGDCNDADIAIHPGATETCNGVDDNCNGTTDDGTDMTCAQGSSRSCVSGPCTGTEACTAGTCIWSGTCELATTESCNGSDDDCDGLTDEGFACVLGARETCTPTGGGTGNRTCVSGCVWGICVAGAEVACNNIDDDADTITDEGSWCVVTGVPTTLELLGIGGSASNDVWVVGTTGTILRWNGSAWVTVTSGVLVNLEDAWASSTTNAWAVGDRGTILYWNGSAWNPESAAGYTGSLNAVWGSSAADVWAVGNSGKILHRTGGAWVDSPSGTARHLLGVWGLTADFVWAVGLSATVRRWDGATWNDASPGGTTALNWVAGSSTTDVWVVGNSGYIFHWNGTEWNSSRSGTTAWNGVWAASPSLAWIVGQGGSIYRWNGTAWGTVTSGTSNHLNAIWGASAAEVWAVGAAGTIVRWRQ